MQRILVIGCGGAGKTVLSRDLGKRLNIPVVHLDQLFWLPGWKKQTREAFDKALDAELSKDRWIMDGNYTRTLSRRLEFADTVILLRYSRFCCLTGVLKRQLLYLGKSRPDITHGCRERIDMEFLRYIWNYNRTTLPAVKDRLSARSSQSELIELNSRREAKAFLDNLPDRNIRSPANT